VIEMKNALDGKDGKDGVKGIDDPFANIVIEGVEITPIESSLADLDADASIIDKDDAKKWISNNYEIMISTYVVGRKNNHPFTQYPYVDYLRIQYKRTGRNKVKSGK
jgi:hypothetical protein